jgi:ABC-type glycerol-3-phosphate transport system substrate-binding protein
VTPTFYSWITNLHPSIPAVNSDFNGKTPLNMQIAPTQGFGIDRFVAEAKDKTSTWDVYVGMTPFVEMVSLVKADVIVPWDDFIPKQVVDDILPSIKAECTYNGKLYSWPFLLDIITMGWNSEITDKAGIKDNPPKDWDTYLKYGKQVQDSKSAQYGVTFDAHGWRSLAPFTHSLSTDVYYDDGNGGKLFDFTNPAALEALQLMKKMMPLSEPNVLNPGTSDGGVNDTPDEASFAAQEVAYYCKYQNAPLRFAATWPDPKKLGLAPIPKFSNGVGSTVFWTTGSCLFKYGQNKEKVVDYLKALTYDGRIWKDSIAGSATAHPGQLPPYKSLYDGWNSNKPDWMQDFVGLVRAQLDVAKAIPNQKYGLTQFFIGQPFWEKYLKGEESDPKKAAQAAKDAVAAENKKSP